MNIILVVLFLLSTLVVFIESHNPINPVKAKTWVVITNELEGGRELKIHCKSGNDDLGFHVLRQHDWFQWHFRPNYFDNTLFFCAMDWGEGGIHWFDIYVQHRDYDRCKHCHWFVKKGGPCLSLSDHQACYHWNPQGMMLRESESFD
ncbi:unnamed protein product [Linum tenue]|uniref:S-protein homolog n=1 Tax=Linum tenue TaxID=586396 RepID=A0AAV0HDC5_9ROSI|nr:unnamed protein product [Linum tenue]